MIKFLYTLRAQTIGNNFSIGIFESLDLATETIKSVANKLDSQRSDFDIEITKSNYSKVLFVHRIIGNSKIHIMDVHYDSFVLNENIWE